MDTKEAIEWIEDLVNDYSEVEGNESIVDDFRKIIFLLQQGKKYKKYKLMWKGLEPFKEILVTADCFISEYGKESLGMKMYELKQKYFPKETNEYKEGEE